jgi:SLBB domain
MNYFLKPFTIVLFFSAIIFAQNSELQVGSNLNQLRQSQGAFYDYSDPSTINIKVSVWGFVKFPGKYVIPIESNIYDLLSYAGGPTEDAHLDDLRLFRTAEDSIHSMIKFNYNDLLWDENLNQFKNAPGLEAGDIVLVPGSQRLYFKDYLQIGLSVFSALISLSILILNISK